jgi:hypothetical protein
MCTYYMNTPSTASPPPPPPSPHPHVQSEGDEDIEGRTWGTDGGLTNTEEATADQYNYGGGRTNRPGRNWITGDTFPSMDVSIAFSDLVM